MRIDPYCHLNCEPTGKLKEKVGEAMGDSGMRDGGTDEKVQRKVGDVKKVCGK